MSIHVFLKSIQVIKSHFLLVLLLLFIIIANYNNIRNAVQSTLDEDRLTDAQQLSYKYRQQVHRIINTRTILARLCRAGPMDASTVVCYYYYYYYY